MTKPDTPDIVGRLRTNSCQLDNETRDDAEKRRLRIELTAADEIDRLRAELARTERNRDMWKGQVERQAERLTTVSAALAKYQWRAMDSAPRDKAVLISGGTYYDSSDMVGSRPFNAVTLAVWYGSRDGYEWQGESSGGHDEHYWHAPTHWLPLPEPPSEETK